MLKSILALLAAALMSSSLTSQEPNLAGHWTIDPKFVAPGQANPQICENGCVITQEAGVLNVKVGNQVATFRLDGVPTMRKLQVGQYAPEVQTTAKWQGQVLQIVRVIRVDDVVREDRSRLSIQSGRLIIESLVGGIQKHWEYVITK